MIVIADAGPILHLFWVGASRWALPDQPISVVHEVWEEVRRHAPEALRDKRLRHEGAVTLPYPEELSPWSSLDSGELAALSYAIRHGNAEDILVLCDEHEARAVCTRLGIPVTGSIGLIVQAFYAGRTTAETATTTLRNLPGNGRLHVTKALIEEAVLMVDRL